MLICLCTKCHTKVEWHIFKGPGDKRNRKIKGNSRKDAKLMEMLWKAHYGNNKCPSSTN